MAIFTIVVIYYLYKRFSRGEEKQSYSFAYCINEVKEKIKVKLNISTDTGSYL